MVVIINGNNKNSNNSSDPIVSFVVFEIHNVADQTTQCHNKSFNADM